MRALRNILSKSARKLATSLWIATSLCAFVATSVLAAEETCEKRKYQAREVIADSANAACSTAYPAGSSSDPPITRTWTAAHAEPVGDGWSGYCVATLTTRQVMGDGSIGENSGEARVGNYSSIIVQEPCGPACEAGLEVARGYFSLGFSDTGRVPGIVCNAGCTAVFDGSMTAVGRALQDNKYEYFAKGVYTQDGTVCEVGSKPDLPASEGTGMPPNDCAPGQVLGTFNGKPMCLNSSTGDPVPPSNDPKPPSTSTEDTTTSTTTTTNPDGSTTTTTTTVRTRSDGSKDTTVETTTTNPDGSKTTDTTKTEEKPSEDDFCLKNPNAEGCGGRSFGGSCGGFNCEGDPIMCAMAREQHKRNCTLFETETAQSELGKAVVNGTDPLAATLPTPANAQVIPLPTSLDQTSFIGGECLSNQTIVVRGQAIDIPFSDLCDTLAVMGLVVVAFALFAGYRIVAGAF